MKTNQYLAAAIVLGGAICGTFIGGGVVAAAEPLLMFRPSYICSCPPPYCKKIAPPITSVPPARCCDDYCKKPLPWWCVPSARLCDDYCKKPEPHCLPPQACRTCPNCGR